MCVSGRSIDEHDKNFALVLERARQENLIFNPKKVKLCINEVPFVGHILTPQGLKPDPQKIKAITNIPPPIDKTGIKRFLGMVNYLTEFIPDHRRLTEDQAAFVWEEPQQPVTTAPIWAYFENNKQVTLSVDASSTGLCAEIRQEEHSVANASKTLTDSQKRYVQIEKELLAIQFGAERFHAYIYGRPLQ